MIAMLRRMLALVLILIGALALGWVGFHLASAAWFDRETRAALDILRQAPPSPSAASPARIDVGEPIGTLEIARVGLTGVVVEGDSDDVLDRAIGHLPDTPLPWHDGNSALAAHRDTIFRPLKGVRLGDVLRLKTPHGDFDYRVTDTLIVKPNEVWVLDPTPVATLTLISCWPFNYIGNAPERFIVRAERLPTRSVRLQPDSAGRQLDSHATSTLN
jgi:sortase A